jgi:hypothetical protein
MSSSGGGIINCTNFKVSQDETFVYIKILGIKYPKSDEPEYHVDSTDFQFFMEPYQLKLNFQALLNAEGESNTFVYNKDKHYVTCRVEKASKGEVFEGLENIEELVKV